MARYPSESPLSVSAQALAMSEHYPTFTRTGTREHATWTGTVTPLAGCQSYRVQVRYTLGESPKTIVVKPELTDRGDGQPIPHRYSDGSLCLYWPAQKSWTPQKLIARTVIPWIPLWLYHYEVWLATGVWHGGGTSHSLKSPADAGR